MATILLIDDSPDIRALVRLLLEQGGHRVLEAEEGRSGLDRVRTERPDLVLTDLALPGLSGWDIARILKADPQTSSIPVVALTAHAMRGDREKAIALGCDGFIVKPIDDERFEPQIRAFLPATAVTEPPPAPVLQAPEPPERPVAPPIVHRRGVGRRILVVDDNPGVRELLRGYLNSAGFEVLTAPDGLSALERVEDDRPELVVLDVMLPGLDGYEVTARLKDREDAAFLPVVLVTAGTLDRERGLEAGADDFLGKPIERVELLVRVRSLLRLRDAVEEARRQAEALRRLDRSKQRFVAALVHDLRTPLNSIALTVEALKLGSVSPEETVEDLEILGRNILQMDEMLADMLDYSRAVSVEQPLNLSAFDPRSLLDEVAGSLTATATHRNLHLLVDAAPDLPDEVVLDYARCRQVIANLASNALKFTESGQVALRARSDGPGRWLVEVEDTGVGIAADDLDRIFEEFEQARIGRPTDAPGTGLGLAIVRELTSRLGGRVEVQSVVGQGSTFRIHWPDRLAEEADRQHVGAAG